MTDDKIIIGVHNCYGELDDLMLINPDCNIGEGLLRPLNQLYQDLLLGNIQLIPIGEIEDFKKVSAFMWFDIPDYNDEKVKQSFGAGKTNILFLQESKITRPEQWNIEQHHRYYRVYTWDSDLIDNKKYFHLFPCQDMPKHVDSLPFSDKKLCCMIASGKNSQQPNELYSQRINAIEWFIRNKPESFDLYGQNWNAEIPVYKGSVTKKIEVIRKYKFAICYENAQNFNSYITEKIFDVMKAGSVPIYYGAINVTDFIPQECFINPFKFNSKNKMYEELYNYISNMKEEEYDKYIFNINKFLASEKSRIFSTEYFSKYIRDEIQKWLNREYLECPKLNSVIPAYDGEPYIEGKDPLVSIIIPTYNRNNFLPNAIKSVLNQSIQDLECIVVNDGGEDITNVITNFNDKRLTHKCLFKNRGVSGARNFGILEAKGKYIGFLDSDDILYPYHLETLLSTLQNSEYKIAYSDAYRAYQTKQPDNSYKTHRKDLVYSVDYDPKMLLVQNISPIQCLLFERELLKETGLFDEAIAIYEDWLKLIDLSLHNLFVHIPMVTSEYSWRDDGTTTASAKENNIRYSTYIPEVYKRYEKYCTPEIIMQQDQILEIRNVRRLD